MLKLKKCDIIYMIGHDIHIAEINKIYYMISRLKIKPTIKSK